jgi:eukaryotic-like serine/threonine-protein kinase
MTKPESRRLDSWKEISAYLGRTVRTVQRWERIEGLPTHRHVHQDQSSVYAFTDELDEWHKARSVSKLSPNHTSQHDSDQLNAVRQTRLRAEYLLKTRTAESLLGAVRQLQSAVALDPTDPMSYAALSEAYCTLSGNEIWAPEDGYPKARAAATQALSLDDRLAQAHATLAMVHNMYEWNWAAAEKRFGTAIALSPTCATPYHWLGLMYINAGRPEQAQEPLQHAAELDPLSPAIATNIGRPLLFLGKYDLAIKHFEKAFDLDPSFWMAHLFIAWAHSAARRMDAAVDEARKAMERSGGIRVTTVVLAEACAWAGDHEEASRLVSAAIADPQVRYLSPYRIARVYVALGDHDAAFQWLERALSDRSLGSTTCLSRDPALISIRNDERFERYLRALHL